MNQANNYGYNALDDYQDYIIFKSEKETFKDVQVKGGLALGIGQRG